LCRRLGFPVGPVELGGYAPGGFWGAGEGDLVAEAGEHADVVADLPGVAAVLVVVVRAEVVVAQAGAEGRRYTVHTRRRDVGKSWREVCRGPSGAVILARRKSLALRHRSGEGRQPTPSTIRSV
jgi:hypothetical protein